MTREDAKSRFKALLSERSNGDQPEGIVACMLDFYRDERVADCRIEDDGDMLLYQWGTYDWGQGRWFDLNITRQFIPAGGDDDQGIFQLSLSMKYTPTPDLDALGSGNRWCGSPGELSEFSDFVKSSAALKAVTGRPCDKFKVEYSQAG
jgi:hypothetical protein